MKQPNYDELQKYFAREYLTLEQLVEKSAINRQVILDLIEAECVPAHSYEWRQLINISDPMGDYTTQLPVVRYYHPSLLDWLERAAQLAQTRTLPEVAEHVRKQFIQEFEETFQGTITPGCKNSAQVWHYFVTGVWGICLQEISVPFMAKKELSRLKISQLVKPESEHQLTAEETKELQEAIETYESAIKQFAPHFYPRSSQCREVEPAKRKYLTCHQTKQ